LEKFYTYKTLNKLLIILISFAFVLPAKAQDKAVAVPGPKPYGVIDTTDLKLKSCDFEKDASAEVLFDTEEIKMSEFGDITILRHKRIKIFNDKGKDEANINIEYINRIADIEAQTINLNGKTIEYTPVDSKLFYKQKVNKEEKSMNFTFPNVKAGSVIELQYKWKLSYYLPPWYFEAKIPTRYSSIDVNIPGGVGIDVASKVNQPYLKDTSISLRNSSDYEVIKVLSNVHSFVDEPYMTPAYDNVQRVTFKAGLKFWAGVSIELMDDNDFGKQLDDKLTDEKAILAKVDSIKLPRADSTENKSLKISYLFNLVKNRMTWDKTDQWFTVAGVKKAWDKKTGNGTEINLALYHLLHIAGIEAYPVEVSTPDNGSVDPNDPGLGQFDKTVVYIPVDTVKYYILDATDKHNTYNHIPFDLLSTYGLAVNPKSGFCSLISILSDAPTKQLVYINAAINAAGKMTGTADISSDTYNKSADNKLYKDLGEKKYIDYLADNDNDLKISSLKRENTEDDTLPLEQHLDFDLNLTASDENYIYFNPNLFTSFGTNPFLSEKRYSNIDFTYTSNYTISGTYKLPEGYKVDALPKNEILIMADKSISFKRLSGEQDGSVLVRYIIKRNRSYYKKEEYPALYKFYKEMFQMLNEQIVLKKI